MTMLSLALVVFIPHEARPERPVQADLGSVGPTWPIREADLLESLVERAQASQRNGTSAVFSRNLRARAQAYATMPPSLGLPRADRDRSHLSDPTVVVSSDVMNSDGRLLAAAGTRLNPLEHMTFSGRLVFIDATDERQLRWARRQLADGGSTVRDRLILTGGAPGAVSRDLGHAAYFDQNGQLARRFGIEAVPALVSTDPSAPHARLLVREVALIEGGQ